jgi:hypothetical protein
MSNEAWKRNLAVPFFSQRENVYVWKQCDSQTGIEIPNGKNISMAYCSCNITSLCMILHYLGITKDSPDEMMRKVFSSEDTDMQKWHTEENGPDELEFNGNMKLIANKIYGVSSGLINTNACTLEQTKKFIAAGYPVWFSFGSQSHNRHGHIAVLRGFTPDGDVIINDPWGDAADPYGYLKPEGLPGYYYSADPSVPMCSWGLGTGDNCVIKKSEFAKISGSPLFQSLVIKPPKLWDFPVKTGLLKAASEAEEQEAVRACFDRENWSERMDHGERMVVNGFPVCDNGKWHDGIHLSGTEGAYIYPIGPGRLAAARNAGSAGEKDGDSSNFVLVRHFVPETESSGTKTFYSCYMHLGAVDIAQRIRSRFTLASEQDNVRQQENRDWLDQLTDHILPKRAVVRIEGTATGNDSLSLPVYKKNLTEKIGTLKDRELVYLCPVDNRNKELLETIHGSENNAQLAQLYAVLNDAETYTYRAQGGMWYRIFTKVNCSKDGSYEWEDGFVKSGHVLPQVLNIKEFVYYRRKLASLIKGETVVFNDEDTDSSAFEKAPVLKEKWKSVMNRQLKAVFPFISDGSTSRAAFDAAEKHYEEELSAVKETVGTYAVRTAVWNDFVARLTNLSSVLLGYPWGQVDEPFKMSDSWVKQMKDTWIKLYGKCFSGTGSADSWKTFEAQLSAYCPRNVDYHIEMNACTPAGTFGRYLGTEQVHIELFSDEPLIPDGEPDGADRWKQIKGKDSGKYFDKRTTAKLFIDAKIFCAPYFKHTDAEVIRLAELGKFYAEKQSAIRHVLVNHVNRLLVKDEAWFRKMMKGCVGFYECNENNEKLLYKENEESFLTPVVKKELGIQIKNDASWFYHPVQFVLWLNECQKRVL